ncbi:MAG: patatin-like phospholipase family protein [Planctomycetota bacterium]|jgi:predicted acylesterase/phospholipase RssA
MSDQLSARQLAATDDLVQQTFAEKDKILAPCGPGRFRVFKRMAANPDNHMAVSFSGGGVPSLVGNCALLGILEELDVIPNVKEVWGVSAGSIVAGALATGVPRDEVYRLIESMDRPGGLDVSKWRLIKSVFRFLIRRELPEGFVQGNVFREVIHAGMKVETFEEAAIPLRIITCTDDGRAEKVIHRQGDILPAIMASMCLPGIMCPMPDWRGKVTGYFDGGIVENTPLVSVIDDHLREGRTTKLFVVCTRFTGAAKIKRPTNFATRFMNVLYHFQDTVWHHHQLVADQTPNCKYVVLNPHVQRGSLLNFEHLEYDYLIARKMFKQQLSNAGLAGRFGAH